MHALIPRRRRLTFMLPLLSALALALALLAPAPVSADHRVQPARIDGEHRFDTAANISAATFDQAGTVHVVTGQDFPDALAGSYAAGVVDGPLLLVTRDGVPQRTWDELERLDAATVVLIGGESAISASVESELQAQGYDTERVHGPDRYRTSAAVALHYGDDGQVGTVADERTALLASGEDFPDALAAGPIAAAANLPLLLTPTDRSVATVDTALEELDIDRIIVVGGPAAVSAAVVAHHQDRGYEVERWAGDNRMDTARVVADNAIARFGFTYERILLARGDAYPDALAASIHGGLLGAPLLLTATPTILSSETSRWLTLACPEVAIVRAVGGTAAVSVGTLDDAVTAAEACHQPEPHTQQSYIQSPQERLTLQPGDEREITVSFGEDEPVPIDITLFPCEVHDATDPNDRTFADVNNDGFADGVASTSTNRAVITELETQEIEPTRYLAAVRPNPETGTVRYTVESAGEDCAVNTVFHDANDNNQLDVSDEGWPLEHWNTGEIEWSQGS